MAKRRIASVDGARPQFIKAAAVSRALESTFDETLIHTGQHYDQKMSGVFFSEMGIRPPKHNLGVGSGSHAEQTGAMLIALEKLFVELKPELVLVYGDTNSTLAGALAAAKIHIPIAHVEAGLRSFNRAMPEEINRVLTDHVSNWLFCPTTIAVMNLEKEGIVEGVHKVGDVMNDALLHHLSQARERSDVLNRLGIKRGHYALATIHRAANTDNSESMRAIMNGFSQLSTQIILPLHPRTKKLLTQYKLSHPKNVTLIEPVGYLDMLVLEENANCILTDSGGVQKEAYLLGVRCITLREETEWLETVEAGWNQLVGSDSEKIKSAYETWSQPAVRPQHYGDGHTSEKISAVLAYHT
ncbi:MAG: UDP-N-acetylglucosamine 2-epimerase (non-hydrolyzing) [Anaerolineae bacterium]|nr:UDP-N-acetylglucosamine 2-epimerase (non-hydrolyzing) [Anaerolineae bacterium]